MRNMKWYRMVLKSKTMEEAYIIISENLKRPSFIHEKDNAYAAYKEIFGVELISPEVRREIADKEEIAKLKAELEAMRASKEPAPEEAISDVDIQEKTEALPDEILIKSKEEFRKIHPEIKGLKNYQAWVKYAAEHGLEK